MDAPQVIGKRIRRLRDERGWSQNDLGRQIGMTSENISRLENGKQTPRSTTLRKLAEAFAVDYNLLAGEPEEQAEQLDRIEAKLDTLIARLVEDAEVVRLPAPPRLHPSNKPTPEDQ